MKITLLLCKSLKTCYSEYSSLMHSDVKIFLIFLLTFKKSQKEFRGIR